MRSNRGTIFALVFVLTCAPGCVTAQPDPPRVTEANPPSEDQALRAAYNRTVFDSAVYQRENLRPLRPLAPDANGEVIVATVTSMDGTVGELLPVNGAGVWVTGVPEVRDICRAFTGDVA